MKSDGLAPEYRAFLRRREWQRRLKGRLRGESPLLTFSALLVLMILGSWIDDRTTRFMAALGYRSGGALSAVLAAAFASCLALGLASIGSRVLARIVAKRMVIARISLLLVSVITGVAAVGALLKSCSSFGVDRQEAWLQVAIGAGLALVAGMAFRGSRYLDPTDDQQ